jgi:hypothetical protein
MSAFFSPVSLQPGWHQWLLDFLAGHSNPRFNRLGRSLALAPPRSLSASDPWVGTRLLNTITVWNPPPEQVARQATISAMMTAWVEQPLTNGAVFFVPRILQRQWQRLSRHLHVLDAIQVDDLPICVHLTLPVVIIVLTHHVRELPSESTRLDLSTNAAAIRWHRDQATFVRFAKTRFEFTSSTAPHARPCATHYHLHCCRVGVPFTTRLKFSEGLSLPPLPVHRQNSTRPRTLGSPFRPRSPNARTHATVQMDVIHAWSAGTHKQYQGKLRIVRRFEGRLGTSILSKTQIKRPGVGPAVTLMWAQQHYSIQVPQWKNKNFTDISDSMAYSTVRSLCSAVSMFHKLDLQMAFPGKVYLDPSYRVLMGLRCSPTDELGMASGRLGDESKPSIALLPRHVRALDRLLEQRFIDTQDPGLHRELARAGLANTLAWLAWLRASELFSLRWCDLDVTLPEDGPIHDLPPKVGVVQARLLEQTKTNRTKVANVVIAFQTGSGLTPGTWMLRLRSLMGLNNITAKECTKPIFQHRSGTN